MAPSRWFRREGPFVGTHCALENSSDQLRRRVANTRGALVMQLTGALQHEFNRLILRLALACLRKYYAVVSALDLGALLPQPVNGQSRSKGQDFAQYPVSHEPRANAEGHLKRYQYQQPAAGKGFPVYRGQGT
jgi:hypothetical protein